MWMLISKYLDDATAVHLCLGRLLEGVQYHQQLHGRVFVLWASGWPAKGTVSSLCRQFKALQLRFGSTRDQGILFNTFHYQEAGAVFARHVHNLLDPGEAAGMICVTSM